MRKFLLFLDSIGHQWGVLVTGVTVTLIVGGIEHYEQSSLSWKSYCLVLGIALFAACFLAWRQENDRAERAEAQTEEMRRKYFDERPQLGLEIGGPKGPKAWGDVMSSDRGWFLLQHLSGRKARSICFDPVPSKRGRFTLHFDAVPFLDPPRPTSLTYHIREVGFPQLSAHDMDTIGNIEGKMLAQFLDDSPLALIELKYLLIARFKDRDGEERTRDFNLVFDKQTFAFLPNTD